MSVEIEWDWQLGHPLPANAPQHVRHFYQHVADSVSTWKDAPSHEHRMLWNKARDACISAMVGYLLDAEQRLGPDLLNDWGPCDRNEAIKQCMDRRKFWEEDQRVIASLHEQLAAATDPPAIRRDASKVLAHHAEELTMLAGQLREAGY